MATDDALMTDFDIMLEKKKRKRPWWKSQQSPKICKQLAKQLLGRMEQAAHEDEQLRNSGRLVIRKLILLPEFVEALGKTYLHRTLIENGVLRVIALWIKPSANGSVPYFEITKRLIESLLGVEGIEVKHLNQCDLLKVLMKLRENKNVPRVNRQLASELVTRWVRIVFNNPTRLKKEEPNLADW